MRGKLAILSILLVLLFASCSGGGGWSSAANVSSSEGDSFGPSMAIDNNENVHLVWYDYTPGNNDIFYSSKAGNGSFSKAVNLTNNSGPSTSPTLVAGKSSLYLFWADYTPGASHILAATKSGDSPWSKAEDLLPDSTGCENPYAVVDSEGDIHLVWRGKVDYYYDRIFYATKASTPLPTPTPTPTPTATPVPEATPTPTPAITPLPVPTSIPMKTYVNDQFGYAMAYPDTWLLYDYYPNDVQITPQVGIVNVLIEESDLAEGATLKSFYTGDIENYRGNYTNFELVSTTEVRAGDALPGVEAVFVASPKQTPELKYKYRILYMVRGQQGFAIITYSLLDTWETNAPVFDSMIKSFNLSVTQPKPQPTPTPTPTPTPATTEVAIAAGWTSPQIVSQDEGVSTEPVLAIDSHNTLHLAWTNNASGNWEVFYRSKPAGGEWSEPVNVSHNAGDSQAPAIAVDSRGIVYLAWHDYSNGNWETMYASRSNDGSWTTPFNISADSGNSGSPSLAVDSKDGIHLVWNDDTSGNWEILYSTKPLNGSWSKAINVSDTKGQSGDPVITIDKGDGVHIAWCDDTPGNWEIFYKEK
jgi:hypothetical protein